MRPEQTLTWMREGTERLPGDVTARRSELGTGPALEIAATDTGARWTIEGAGSAAPVSTPLATLAAWLTGRPGSVPPDAPELPPWL